MVDRVNYLVSNSIAPSTANLYRRAWSLFRTCMILLNISYIGLQDLPLSENRILLFIGYLDLEGYAPSTITTYLSALSYVHKLKGLSDPISSFVVQKALLGSIKLRSSFDTRLPITIGILNRLVNAVNTTISGAYYIALFKSMYLISFFALMRVGEVTKDSKGEVALNVNQVTIFDNYATITIRKFKHNSSQQPFDLILVRQQDINICPINALINYLRLRGLSDGPLFSLPNLEPISREFFLKNLNLNLRFCGLDTKVFKSHSFRIGGASYYAELGLSDGQIRLIGRWRSNAFLKYIRCQRVRLAISEPISHHISEL